MEENTKAFVITGPTSGYGQVTALELAKHGLVVLVGRDPTKLDAMQKSIEHNGGKAQSVVCDLSDLKSVKRATDTLIALKLPIAAVINNAGVGGGDASKKSAQGWDLVYATNHFGPFAFTEALLPQLADGTTVLFLASAVENPERKPAVMAGFRGARFVSVEASARGEWKPGGSKNVGMDAYATSKQASLATALVLARENPRLRINAVEPGFSPATGLGRGANPIAVFLAKALSFLALLIDGGTTPARTAKVVTRLALNEEKQTGVYFNEKGAPMKGSVQISDPKFQEQVVAETRAFLSKNAA